MVKKEISTVAQHHYAGYASEFWEKDLNWQNSLPTPSPQGEHKKHCAKLDWWVDAVAEAKTFSPSFVDIIWEKWYFENEKDVDYLLKRLEAIKERSIYPTSIVNPRLIGFKYYGKEQYVYAGLPKRKQVLFTWLKSPWSYIWFTLWVLVQLKFRLFIG